MLRATDLLVMLNRIAGRNPDSIKKIEEFLARDLEVTAPLAIEVAVEEGDPMGRALANVLLRHADPRLAMRLYRRLPAQSASLKEAAVVVATQIAGAAERIPGITLTLVASTKISLAHWLSDAGQHHQAAIELQQVVDSLEQLYLSDSEGSEPLLAEAQRHYAETLNELGRRDEALTAARRACELFEAMDARSPGSKRVDLAISLQVLSTVLESTGRRRESLSLARKALVIREAIVETAPKLLPDVASSLNSLAIGLAGVGDHHEALPLIQRSVQIYSDFYDQNPDAWAADFAFALEVEGMVLALNGATFEAIRSTERSAALYRALAVERRRAVLPHLANVEGNLAIRLRDSGEFEKAQPFAQAAVECWRELVAEDEQAYGPGLAHALSSLALLLRDAGQYESGLEAARESLKMRIRQAKLEPAKFLPALSISLALLSHGLCDIGRYAEASRYARKVVSVEQVLVATDRSASLLTLASAVHNLGLLLRKSGQLSESLECARSAVTLYSELCTGNGTKYGREQTTAMNTLAVRLAQCGEVSEALQVSRNCCGLLEIWHEENGPLWRSQFARALQTYSNRLADAGQLAESCTQAERVVELRRALCESEPDNPVLQRDLADALTNLAVRLEHAGHSEQALRVMEAAGRFGRAQELCDLTAKPPGL